MNLIKRTLQWLIGIRHRPPDQPTESSASELHEAANAKHNAANALRTVGRGDMAADKESEAAMLQQLADEMELTGKQWR